MRYTFEELGWKLVQSSTGDINDNGQDVLTHRTTIRLWDDGTWSRVLLAGRQGKVLCWMAHPDTEDDCKWKIQFGTRPAFGQVSSTAEAGPQPLQVLTWIPPKYIEEHGELFDIEFDESRLRLALYMSDGTIFFFEFL